MHTPNIAHLKGLRKMNRHGGFTLVEVLVVLAILVILFGLLFAPMMAGLDMATQGQINVRLQEIARAAAEQMRRELANAIYVYPPPTYPVGTSAVTDYSEIVFVPAETDAEGNLVTPRRPRMFPNGEYKVVRFCVKPPDLSNGKTYDDHNPFVLVRQEGAYQWDPALGRYVFGSFDSNGDFVPGQAIVENALTPRENYDIPATATICLDDKTMHVGYVEQCPNDGSTNLVYLHEHVKFQPQRIMGEALAAQENNAVYQARHGMWMGTPNNGLIPLAGPLSQATSELQPRLLLYRWDGSAYNQIVLDTFNIVPPELKLRYNSATGTVLVGEWRTVKIEVPNPGTAPGAGQFYPLRIEGDTYDGSGSGTQTAPVAPIYPKPPTEWGEPQMPIAYRINPEKSDSSGAPAKIVPGSIRVAAVATTANDTRRAQYTYVQEINQADLGLYEFSVFMPDNQTWAEVRFNRYEPPAPPQFGPNLDTFALYISYYYRRNFAPGGEYRDDVLYADYSTAEIINITLIPQRFVDLEPYRSGAQNLVVPPDQPVTAVPVRTQAVLHISRH